MSDYTSHAAELLKEIDEMASKLPEEATKKLREAVYAYMPLRKSCLEELLTFITDDSTSNKDNASRFKSRCETMRSAVAQPFEDALKNIVLSTEAAAAGYGWQMSNKVKEEQFFSGLSGVNVAEVRDYLVSNKQSLEEYTKTLDEKWKTIKSKEDDLQTEEQKNYQEALDMTNRIIAEFATQERTLKEDFSKAGSYALTGLQKGSSIVEWILQQLINAPDGTGKLIELISEKLNETNKKWLETNAAIVGRIVNYKNLVQAEKGGILPLFKETRKEVSEYWDKYGVEKAETKYKGAKDTLDNWISACPTSAQKEDGKSFSEAALSALEKHMSNVKSVASTFESNWNGVFKGALKTDVIDELIETAPWRMRAKTLVEINTPDVVARFLENMNGYYEGSLEEPLDKLRDYVKTFPSEQQDDALKVIDACKASMEKAVRDRIKNMQQEIGASLNWFKASSIEETFNRDELKQSVS